MNGGTSKIIIFVVLFILLIPTPIKLKDGGSVEYKSLISKVTKVHRLEANGNYEDGIIIEIFGYKIYEDIDTVSEDK